MSMYRKQLQIISSVILVATTLIFSMPVNGFSLRFDQKLFVPQWDVSNVLNSSSPIRTGIKVSVGEFSTNRFQLGFSRNGIKIGNVEFERTSLGNRTIIKDSAGCYFELDVKLAKHENASLIKLRSKKHSVEMDYRQFQDFSRLSVRQKSDLQSVMEDSKSNKDLLLMAETAQRISNSNSQLVSDSFICTKEVYGCLAAAVAWIGSVGALILACPESVGLGCAAALVAHNVLGGAAATQCAYAIQVCQKPDPIKKAGDEIQFAEILF